MTKLALLLLLALPIHAQSSQHSVTLTWIDTVNPIGTTYNVYRAPGLCTGTPAFFEIASAIAILTYIDLAVVPSSYCYEVTASYGGLESDPSPTALAVVPDNFVSDPAPPAGLFTLPGPMVIQ